MKKVFLLLSVLVGLPVVVSSCGQPQPSEAPPPHEEKGSFRVEVSRNGFNNTPGEFQLEVEPGQEVEITFVYGDGDFPQNNPHIVAIPDYGIENIVLDQENPEVTVRFTATSARKVTFMCTNVTCVGYTNLQGGVIVPHEHSH